MAEIGSGRIVFCALGRHFLSATGILIFAASFASAEAPSWFGKDTRAGSGWTFYCSGDSKKENEALNLARADCARKMCMLFGVEISVEQKSEETLKSATSSTVVKENCPQVRIVGRKEKRKIVDCTDDQCLGYIEQFYPMDEYLAEKKRLDNPPITPGFEKTIIVREGNDTFKDPKECRTLLARLAGLGGDEGSQKIAVESLKGSIKECEGLDYRNVDLQNELFGKLNKFTNARGIAYAMMANNKFGVTPALVDKLKFTLELEQLQTEKSRQQAGRILLKHYSSLFYRHGPDGLKNYTDELKSCSASSKVIREWPKGMALKVTVCTPKYQEKGEDCQSTSILQMRWQYASCVCNLGAKSAPQECAQELVAHMDRECPMQMTEACFQLMSTKIAEKMKTKIQAPVR